MAKHCSNIQKGVWGVKLGEGWNEDCYHRCARPSKCSGTGAGRNAIVSIPLWSFKPSRHPFCKYAPTTRSYERAKSRERGMTDSSTDIAPKTAVESRGAAISCLMAFFVRKDTESPGLMGPPILAIAGSP